MSHSVIDKRCSGKPWCNISVSNESFGDPCPPTRKYLEVQYHCLDTRFPSGGGHKNVTPIDFHHQSQTIIETALNSAKSKSSNNNGHNSSQINGNSNVVGGSGSKLNHQHHHHWSTGRPPIIIPLTPLTRPSPSLPSLPSPGQSPPPGIIFVTTNSPKTGTTTTITNTTATISRVAKLNPKPSTTVMVVSPTVVVINGGASSSSLPPLTKSSSSIPSPPFSPSLSAVSIANKSIWINTPSVVGGQIGGHHHTGGHPNSKVIPFSTTKASVSTNHHQHNNQHQQHQPQQQQHQPETSTMSTTESIMSSSKGPNDNDQRPAFSNSNFSKPLESVGVAPYLNDYHVTTTSSSKSGSQTDHYCSQVVSRGITWGPAKVGTIVIEPCPGSSTIGTASWECGSSPPFPSGQWIGFQPNLSTCSSLWIHDLHSRIQNGDLVIKVASELARKTRFDLDDQSPSSSVNGQSSPSSSSSSTNSKVNSIKVQLFGGDIIHSVKLLSRLVSKMDSTLVDILEEKQRHSLVEEFAKSIIEATSNLVDNRNKEAWMDLYYQSSSATTTPLMVNDDDVDEDGSSSQKTEAWTSSEPISQLRSNNNGNSVSVDGGHQLSKKLASSLMRDVESVASLLSETQKMTSDDHFTKAHPNVFFSVHLVSVNKSSRTSSPSASSTSSSYTQEESSIKFPTSDMTLGTAWMKMNDNLVLPLQEAILLDKRLTDSQGFLKVAFLVFRNIGQYLAPTNSEPNNNYYQQNYNGQFGHNQLHHHHHHHNYYSHHYQQHPRMKQRIINSKVITLSILSTGSNTGQQSQQQQQPSSSSDSNRPSRRPLSVQLTKPVVIYFKHIHEVNVSHPECVHWDYNASDWSSSGCWVITTNKSYTGCSCVHLTTFALMMDINDDQIHPLREDSLSFLITGVSCIISAIFLCLLLILFFLSGLSCYRSRIYKNLALCLLCTEILLFIIFTLGTPSASSHASGSDPSLLGAALFSSSSSSTTSSAYITSSSTTTTTTTVLGMHVEKLLCILTGSGLIYLIQATSVLLLLDSVRLYSKARHHCDNIQQPAVVGGGGGGGGRVPPSPLLLVLLLPLSQEYLSKSRKAFYSITYGLPLLIVLVLITLDTLLLNADHSSSSTWSSSPENLFSRIHARGTIFPLIPAYLVSLVSIVYLGLAFTARKQTVNDINLGGQQHMMTGGGHHHHHPQHHHSDGKTESIGGLRGGQSENSKSTLVQESWPLIVLLLVFSLINWSLLTSLSIHVLNSSLTLSTLFSGLNLIQVLLAIFICLVKDDKVSGSLRKRIESLKWMPECLKVSPDSLSSTLTNNTLPTAALGGGQMNVHQTAYYYSLDATQLGASSSPMIKLKTGHHHNQQSLQQHQALHQQTLPPSNKNLNEISSVVSKFQTLSANSGQHYNQHHHQDSGCVGGGQGGRYIPEISPYAAPVPISIPGGGVIHSSHLPPSGTVSLPQAAPDYEDIAPGVGGEYHNYGYNSSQHHLSYHHPSHPHPPHHHYSHQSHYLYHELDPRHSEEPMTDEELQMMSPEEGHLQQQLHHHQHQENHLEHSQRLQLRSSGQHQQYRQEFPSTEFYETQERYLIQGNDGQQNLVIGQGFLNTRSPIYNADAH